ncbi:MAG TPA: ABC transporter ATPase [Bacteroidetes bacterium]|nr:ABC transporter ATPase [Bacteroidota bacterium]
MTDLKNSLTTSQLPATARVWVYQSNREFTDEETRRLSAEVRQFVRGWASHNRPLAASAEVLFNRFVILMVDESYTSASGCSIDASVHFMQQLGEAWQTDFFDRMTFAWKDGDTIRTAPCADFAALYRKGQISDQTLVFDNLVKTKGELEEKWLKPLNESWHRRFV